MIDAAAHGLLASSEEVPYSGPVFLIPHDSIELTHPCFCRFGVALQPTGPLSNVLANTLGNKPVFACCMGRLC